MTEFNCINTKWWKFKYLNINLKKNNVSSISNGFNRTIRTLRDIQLCHWIQT